MYSRSERMLCAGINRHIGAAQFGGIQGVAGRLRDGHVARHDGDGAHLHIGRAQRHDQGDGVVGGGIGVDEEGSRHVDKIAQASLALCGAGLQSSQDGRAAHE